MDVYFDLASGSFQIEFDKEDEDEGGIDTENYREVYATLMTARAWPKLPCAPIKNGSTFKGKPYTDLVAIDFLEQHVTSTLNEKVTNIVLQSVALRVLNEAKVEPDDDEEVEVTVDETELGEPVASSLDAVEAVSESRLDLDGFEDEDDEP